MMKHIYILKYIEYIECVYDSEWLIIIRFIVIVMVACVCEERERESESYIHI